MSNYLLIDNKSALTCNLLVFVLLISAWPSYGFWGKKDHEKEHVVILHGIMNRPFMMSEIAHSLRKAEYKVHNWGYPSRRMMIEDHAENLHKYVQKIATGNTIHFVGFSQGAIIIRYYLTHYQLKNPGRFVMLAPPNHGSELGEYLYENSSIIRFIYKDKSMKQLFASNKEFFEEMGIPPIEFGIIAGIRGNGKGYSSKLPGEDDGSVSLESTKLEGMKDFITLPYRHTVLLSVPDTKKQIVAFLQNGKFEHENGK